MANLGSHYEDLYQDLESLMEENEPKLEPRQLRLIALNDLQGELSGITTEWDAAWRAYYAAITDQNVKRDEAATHRDRVKRVRQFRMKMLNLIDELNHEENAARVVRAQSTIEPSVPSRRSHKLPPIKLPTFSGNITEWRPFWDLFSAMVDNQPDVPPVEKFSQLTTHLEGEAKGALQGLSLTAENYPLALNLLKKRYAKDERVLRILREELANLPAPKHNYLELDRFLMSYNRLTGQINAIEGIKEGNVMTKTVLMNKLAVKTIESVRREYHKADVSLDEIIKYITFFLDTAEVPITNNIVDKSTARASVGQTHQPPLLGVIPTQIKSKFDRTNLNISLRQEIVIPAIWPGRVVIITNRVI